MAIYGQQYGPTMVSLISLYGFHKSKKGSYRVYACMGKILYAEISRFTSEIPNGIVKEISGADHYVFLTNSVETEKTHTEFS